MKTLIIYESIHHGNTLKIAQEIAKVLNADLKKASKINPEELESYDLLGFGSGIYFFQHHKNILDLAKKLPKVHKKPAFIFSTSGASFTRDHKPLKEILLEKDYQVIAEFNCRGWDSYGLLKYIGGISKGHPNQQDLKNARSFALSLLKN